MCFFGLSLLHAQKHVEKTYLDETVRAVIISGEQCFEILLETSDSQDVAVAAYMEGEYQNEVFIQMETLGNTLRIGTDYAPSFEQPNDKLSAHKVLSVKLHIVLPQELKVGLVAGDCQVFTKGQFRELDIAIAGGGCTLKHHADKTQVNTISGFIEADITSGKVNTHSGFGAITSDSIASGYAVYNLKSIRGNIRVNRIN
ncbi:MAG: hypothetical protein RLZZ241_1569 [Bacteroidota bacterium]|jgi:hypothetical protein